MCYECIHFEYRDYGSINYCRYWNCETDETAQCINFESGDE